MLDGVARTSRGAELIWCGLEPLTLFAAHLDGSLQGVQFRNLSAEARVVGAAHFRPLARQVFQEFFVHVVLVLQAAQQPAAGSRNLFGIQGQLLVSRHFDRDRREILQVMARAIFGSARPEDTQNPGLIPGSDRMKMNLRSGFCAQILGQLPQLDSAFTRVRNRDAGRIEREFDGDNFRVNFAFTGFLAHEPFDVVRGRLEFSLMLEVFGRGGPQDFTDGFATWSGFETGANGADFRAAPRLNDHTGIWREDFATDLERMKFGTIVKTNAECWHGILLLRLEPGFT
jgi:hypothetical protein